MHAHTDEYLATDPRLRAWLASVDYGDALRVRRELIDQGVSPELLAQFDRVIGPTREEAMNAADALSQQDEPFSSEEVGPAPRWVHYFAAAVLMLAAVAAFAAWAPPVVAS